LPASSQQLEVAETNWTGFYAGVGTDLSFAGHSASTDYGGTYGGYIDPVAAVTFGRNWQSGSLVYGIESSISGPGRTGEIDWDSDTAYQNRYEWNWAATVRGRVGVTAGDVLLYSAAGVTVADVTLDACERGRFNDVCAANVFSTYVDDKLVGLTAAIGAEVAFSDRLSGFLEYSTTAFEAKVVGQNRNGVDSEVTPHGINSEALRVGVNYSLGASRRSDPVSANVSNSSWGGGYAGVVGTYGMLTNHSGLYYGGTRSTVADQTLGVVGGYNVQRGNFVYGIEADVSGAMEADKTWGDNYLSDHTWNWMTTIRGRAGISTGPALFYTTAGLAFADLELGACDGAVSCTDIGADYDSRYSGVSTGLAAGFGVAVRLNERTAVNAEYTYVGFPFETGTDALTEADAVSQYPGPHTAEAQMFRVGVTYSLGATSSGRADPLHDWSGYYAGAFASGNLLGVAGGSYYGNTSIIEEHGAFGVNAGRNWQRGNFVFGLEAEVQSGTGPTASTYYDEDDYLNSGEWDWSGAIRARAGIATGNALIFATGGVAVADTELWHCYDLVPCFDPSDLNDNSDSYFEEVQYGLTGGFGVEYAINDSTSIIGEYRMTQFSAQRGEGLSDSTYADHTTWSQLVKIGVNYSF
jgi:outer membrane immunogenic protein